MYADRAEEGTVCDCCVEFITLAMNDQFWVAITLYKYLERTMSIPS